MAANRTADVVWNGNLFEGSGRITRVGSGTLSDIGVSWKSRTEDPGGNTSPEELIAAAHAACFSMALSNTLAKRGNDPERLDVRATASFEKVDDGFRMTTMDLAVRGNVPGIDQAAFADAAAAAGQGCPVSQALRGNVDIRVDARLE